MFGSILDNLLVMSTFIEGVSSPPILVNVVILTALKCRSQRQNSTFTYDDLYARLRCPSNMKGHNQGTLLIPKTYRSLLPHMTSLALPYGHNRRVCRLIGAHGCFGAISSVSTAPAYSSHTQAFPGGAFPTF